MKFLCSAVALVLLSALPAQAQQLNLEIDNGRVTLDAVNVPARQILAEWARIGGTKVVGAEKITGAPLTLKLVDMPERQALDIILRNVAGFMAAPRQASALPGASAYDRILIMATSSVVPPQPAGRNAPAPNLGAALNGTQRRVPPRPPNLPPGLGGDPSPSQDDQDIEDDQADTGVMEQPVFTFPTPQGSPGNNNPVFIPMPNGGFGNPAPGTAPVITLQPGANGPTIYNFVPTDQQGAPAQPAGPFGVIGSPQPGMIQTPPPQTPPTRPTRPPG
ncbi:MAG TPA: hypothetical protein VMO26_11695 [Vicinamibacterales bacterium]|nr:hypothetical protein [Vicinamibacterales bacterium]